METLLGRLRTGDADALTQLYDLLFPSLWRLARLRTHAADIAEELVHDVFLSLWVRRAALPRDLDLRVYLAAAVRNRARDLTAHDRVVHALENAVSRVQLDPPAIGTTPSESDATVETAEFYAAYRRALTVLSEREREAVLLRWEEGFTLEQVAGVLGMSVMGARAAILRAQRKVQDGLADYRR